MRIYWHHGMVSSVNIYGTVYSFEWTYYRQQGTDMFYNNHGWKLCVHFSRGLSGKYWNSHGNHYQKAIVILYSIIMMAWFWSIKPARNSYHFCETWGSLFNHATYCSDKPFTDLWDIQEAADIHIHCCLWTTFTWQMSSETHDDVTLI